MKAINTPKFNPGEVVTHKASGELAIVEVALQHCTVHTGLLAITINHMTGDGCSWTFSGEYQLSLGFDRDSIIVDEDLLEIES